jgi:NADH:ubiquinone oxidoreductase subunit 2 (subunit N)
MLNTSYLLLRLLVSNFLILGNYSFYGEHQEMKLTELLNQLNLGNLSILIFLVLSLVEISTDDTTVENAESKE